MRLFRILLLPLCLGLPLGGGCYDWNRSWPAGMDQGPSADLLMGDAPVVDAMLDAVLDTGSADFYFPPGHWVQIPAGKFNTGSTAATDPCRGTNEKLREVTLKQSFEMSATEVTQAQFQAMMNYHPAPFGECPQCPVSKVNWHEAAAYCNKLSNSKGYERCYDCQVVNQELECSDAKNFTGKAIYTCSGYRLPTETEWEHAYRREEKLTYNYYLTQVSAWSEAIANQCETCTKVAAVGKVGWYCGNTDRTRAVGQKPDSIINNPHKLYDMAGNVWEWCHDWYQGTLDPKDLVNPLGIKSFVDPKGPYRSMRGGGYSSHPEYLRAAERNRRPPDPRADDTGFRCVRTLP